MPGRIRSRDGGDGAVRPALSLSGHLRLVCAAGADLGVRRVSRGDGCLSSVCGARRYGYRGHGAPGWRRLWLPLPQATLASLELLAELAIVASASAPIAAAAVP